VYRPQTLLFSFAAVALIGSQAAHGEFAAAFALTGDGASASLTIRRRTRLKHGEPIPVEL